MHYLLRMAKIAGNGSTGRFTVDGTGANQGTSIRQRASGKTLPLKGYGALKGEFAVRKGIDLSKPIAAQAARKHKRSQAAAE